MSDVRDEYIAQVVAGRRFCDIGGLWGTVNEKASVAARHGAASVAMVDIAPPGHELWTRFAEHVAPLEVEQVTANLDDPGTVAQLGGRFDIVHCSGVVYHCPNPVHTLRQLWHVAGEHLVLTSMVVPERIETGVGTLDLGTGGTRYVPYLDARDKEIVLAYWAERSVSGMIGLDIDTGWDVGDYDPWWWLLTPSLLRQMLRSVGFTLVDDAPAWEGRSHTFLARR